MKNNLVIFAGGLGSRLLNSEKVPKPLVNINGKSLLSRIILSFYSKKIISNFHILTCFESNLFKKILHKEIPHIHLTVHEEGLRTGRSGALKYFLDVQNMIDKFFVCNGDTYFMNIKKNEILDPLNSFEYKPIVYLAPTDNTRNDFKQINLNFGKVAKSFQNSGLIYLNKDWFKNKVLKKNNLKDIDDYLFSNKNNSEYAFLSNQILDAGTPDRLSKLRDILR
tara:strand:- start:7 stop:675 length:669 start_codon:yes stop_codon:yes gene_type:complete